MSQDWRNIISAPRDGTIIEVMAEDAGRFHMLWNSAGTNPLVSKEFGIWEAPGGEFTWCEDNGHGPTHWRPAQEGNE